MDRGMGIGLTSVREGGSASKRPKLDGSRRKCLRGGGEGGRERSVREGECSGEKQLS